MSDEEVTEQDVVTLAEAIRVRHWPSTTAAMIARDVLASDWYAERIAQARREVLTEATDAIGGLIAAHRHDSSEPCDLAPALAAVAALRDTP